MKKLKYNFKHVPMKHQMKEMLHHLKHQYSGTLSETGAGKTFPLTTTVEFRIQNGIISNCLYVAPNSILDKIAEEFATWTKLETTVLQGYSREKRIKLIQTDTPVHIINYEALDNYYDYLREKKYDYIIADEAHRIKNHKTACSKAIRKLGALAKFRTIATGTPLCSAPEDIYGLFLFLDQNVFGKYIGRFRDKWCERVTIEMDTFKHGRVSFQKTVGLKEAMEEEFRKTCLSVCILHLKKDCLTLPPKFYEIRKIDISQSLRSAYNEVRKNKMLTLPDGEILEMPSAGVRYRKLSQICSGSILHYDKVIKLGTSGKYEDLDNILYERSDKKTVIWCRHKFVMAELVKRYNSYNPVYQTSDHDNEGARRIFQYDKDCHLIINQLSISDGYELTSSDCAIYFEIPWSYQYFKQSQDRVHRKGSEIHEQIMYFFMPVVKTVEVTAVESMRRKINLADIIHQNEDKILTGKFKFKEKKIVF